jgi:beta-lactam-binding protein with PASTA domain
MRIREIIRSRKFLMHLLLMAVLTFVLFWIAFKLLHFYTHHGESYVVPDFAGMTAEEIMASDAYSDFRVVLFDSIYDNSRQGGIVIDQDPPAGTEVKRRRTVHLTVVSKLQEMVPLPDLGNTARSARSQLEAYGLRLGEVVEVQGEYQGLLVGVYYLGKAIREGERIPKGSLIDIDVSTTNLSGGDGSEEEVMDELDLGL